ncbi:MAG: NAD(+) diphosphatase [Ruminococcus sp.]|nr:NAD(+) diphosphatase [Ruminococcus sp.]MDE7226174.1 NAD(+) diphosphatase [Ruminococcus sp.]
MIQDIEPMKLDNSYNADITADNDSVVFIFDEREIAYRGDCADTFPVFGEIGGASELIYLFSIDGRKYFLCTDTTELSIPEKFSCTDVKNLRRCVNIPRHEVFASATAYHLYKWYASNRFCGECGGTLIHTTAERALLCPHCGELIYPRINPAVIAGVTDGDRILVTRYAGSRGVNYDALVAGFVEIGETPEQTVAREVMEETGLKVKNIRYYKSQPWGYSAGLLMGFYCEADSSDKIVLDESELQSAVWVKREDIKGQPDNFSLTHEMMMKFKSGEIR